MTKLLCSHRVIIKRNEFTYGGYRKIKIIIDEQLDALLTNISGQLIFDIDIYIVAGWSGGFGFEYNGVKLITCARRAVWEDLPTHSLEFIWNHEVGHHFGMVAYGDKNYPDNPDFYSNKKLPDAPRTIYGENPGKNDCLHEGPHCNNGAHYNSEQEIWSGIPTCVMFGDLNCNGHHTPKEYCSECKPIVRKLDLSG